MVHACVFVWLPRGRRRRDGAAYPGSQRVRDQGQVGRHSNSRSIIYMIVPDWLHVEKVVMQVRVTNEHVEIREAGSIA